MPHCLGLDCLNIGVLFSYVIVWRTHICLKVNIMIVFSRLDVTSGVWTTLVVNKKFVLFVWPFHSIGIETFFFIHTGTSASV